MWNPFRKKDWYLKKQLEEQCSDKVEPILCPFNKMMTCGLSFSECQGCKQYANWWVTKGHSWGEHFSGIKSTGWFCTDAGEWLPFPVEGITPVPQYVLDIDKD